MNTFPDAFRWIISHGYVLMFLAMMVEGPVITAAAAFAASIGYFNLAVVFGISILGDLVPDVVYYVIGYWGNIALIERFGARIGLTRDRMERIARLVHTHAWKTMIALKMTPILPTTGLMIIGTTKMPLRKYATISVAITIPKTLFFIAVGYYFGQFYSRIVRYVSNTTYLILGIFFLIVVIDQFYRKYMARAGRTLEQF